MNRKLLAASLLTAASVLALVFVPDREPLVYSMSVSEFLSRGLWDRKVRIQGTLVHGSLCKVEPQCGYRFTIQDTFPWRPDGGASLPSAQQLRVRYDECLIPDTFREVPGLDLKLTVEGERCRTCHAFTATSIVTRSSGRYEIREKAAQPPGPPMRTCERPFPSL